jgi:hypothetical protein
MREACWSKRFRQTPFVDEREINASAPPIRMADVGRSSATAASPHPIAARTRVSIVAFGKLEPQAARDGVRLGQPQGQALPHAVSLAGRVTNQCSRGFVVAEIFLAEVLGEQQPVAAEVFDRRKEAERLDAGDPAFD